MNRRNFIGAAAAAAGSALAALKDAHAAARREVVLRPVQTLPGDVERVWLGEAFWANRLQDWRLANGRIECLNGRESFEARTVALLTRSMNRKRAPARISVRLGLVEPGRPGFAGFLLGIGAGKLDYRSCALAHARGGEGGGFMAVMDDRGELCFRDFSADQRANAFVPQKRDAHQSTGALGSREIVLACCIEPAGRGRFNVELVARDGATGEKIGFALRRDVAERELCGGISLISSPPSQQAGARWWFSEVATGGAKIDEHPERALGPVMGCLHSLNRNVLKLTAQLLPVSAKEHCELRLDYRALPRGHWIQGPRAALGDGYVAAFRLDRWDADTPHQYRIIDPACADRVLYEGRIAADPASKRELRIALYSCILPTARRLDEDSYDPWIAEERVPGRYTPENILFPHRRLIANCDRHDPDLYVFCGDQFYEGYPTRSARDTSEAKLDTLYRWYLWYWAFRDCVRDKPTIVLADDHDVLQGNLWGNAGAGSRLPREEDGGFKWSKDLIRMIYRIEQGHNPDSYDPTPIEYDIPVGYGEFVYGGVSFCLLEDRKFKSPPDMSVAPASARGELLGPRQEEFLEYWSRTSTDLPKICLTASVWASAQTDHEGQPLLDYDSNGYPPDGRTRAVKLLARAKALVLTGDQHLALLARQGIEGHDDGPLFFAGPAAAAFWQRWFEGRGKLRNRRDDDPDTGDFTDAFGNRMRILAAANPKIPHAEFQRRNRTWGKFLSDSRMKSEGYGLIRVDHRSRTARIECWPWDQDPHSGRQFAGWPYLHKLRS
ncbi:MULTISPECIES: alkaline phosphatase D family protein [Steroidobacteraceae]|uniref:alkaline phosphatase D family protein n=1 Tax=Steroidobacteraceae TaxID=2689614 RepID=UPI00101DE507|nr:MULTISPECIES: alkaline phosphatase D family protein [Steroidobacteraceae]